MTHIHVISLFPDMFGSPIAAGIIGRAAKSSCTSAAVLASEVLVRIWDYF